MSPIERAGSSKAKTVLFTAPTYYAHSATGETEDEYDEEGDDYEGEMLEEGEEGDGVEYDDEEMDENGIQRQDYGEDIHSGQIRDGSEFSDDGEVEHGTPILEEDRRGAPAAGAAVRRTSQYNESRGGVHEDDGHLGGDEDEDEQERQSHWEKERQHAMAAQQQAAMAEAQWARDREQQARRALSPQNPNNTQVAPSAPLRQPADGTLSTSTSSSSVLRPIDENDFNPNVPTKKLTVTPSIVRDPTFDFDNPHGERPASANSQARSESIKSASPTSANPAKVRGVEIVDPRDPKFNRMLQPTLRAGEETLYEHVSRGSVDSGRQQNGSTHEGDVSLNSMDTGMTGSSQISATSSNETATGPSVLSKKQKRQSGEGSAEGDKKRKSGGILGLFRKKDKKKKGGKDEENTEPRSSEDSGRRNGTASPSSPRSSADRGLAAQSNGGGGGPSKRDSVTAESMFSTDAALRQQELEAKQALYHQYGVSRGPGDITNTMAPRPAPISVSMTTSNSRNSLQLPNPSASGSQSPSYSGHGQRIRPGSLMGSPSIPGLEVPLLSVLRVFAGEQVEAEATFKTVLLNRTTTASDLVKQAMQRFRLTGFELTEEFYLTVKELGGDERPLGDAEQPLAIFEELSEKAGADSTFAVPSVKRSSVGSISSISSNLSMNPAITRLGMNDWSDDSAVKFYLNRRVPASADMTLDESTSRTSFSEHDSLTADSLTSSTLPSTNSQTSYRFAVRLLIHPSDLPENVVFDPQSNAIIPKNVLQERQVRNGGSHDGMNEISPNAREKIVFFPKNANVSDVIEAGLDRFGIVDGVVDGGDEVEDRVSRRRSVTRVKYNLAVDRDGRGKHISVLVVSRILS